MGFRSESTWNRASSTAYRPPINATLFPQKDLGSFLRRPDPSGPRSFGSLSPKFDPFLKHSRFLCREESAGRIQGRKAVLCSFQIGIRESQRSDLVARHKVEVTKSFRNSNAMGAVS